MNLEDYEYKKVGKGYKVRMSCLNCKKGWWEAWSRVKRGGGKYCNRECQSNHKFHSDPELSKYETRIAPDRYIEVKINCKRCGESAWVRWNRVKVGWGLYCSMACANRDKLDAQNRPSHFGKKNAGVSFDKKAKRHIAYWKDEKGKRHNLPYAKWWWEVNKGEIPGGYHATHKDENWENIDDDNICLISEDDYGKRISQRMMGHEHSDETKLKMSKTHTGKTLSATHKLAISNANRKSWDDGIYDDVHIGKYNRNWKDGDIKTYPREYNETLRNQVKGRDKFKCQICHLDQVNVEGSHHVHHIDGDKQNNDSDNLITLCVQCHTKIHLGRDNENVVILAFRSMLKY